MKIVEGNFKKAEVVEEVFHVGNCLKEQLEESGVLGCQDGSFLLFFDSGAFLNILASAPETGECLLMLEMGKAALLAGVYTTDGED